MWSLEPRLLLRRWLPLGAVLALAGVSAACFQPMYAERTPNGGPGLREIMAAVEVEQIPAPAGTPLSRIAVEVRNELLFGLTGGGGAAPQTHRLAIRLVPANNAIILDRTTGRYEFQNFALDATYVLTEIVSNKKVMNGTALSRVTYSAPGQEQRFAQDRAKRNAETLAAREIAEQIKSRLASFFIAGT